MKHWIGVISSKAIYDSVIKGEHNWFCLNAKVEVGDTFFLFATSKVTKDSGLFGHFEVVNVDFFSLKPYWDPSHIVNNEFFLGNNFETKKGKLLSK